MRFKRTLRSIVYRAVTESCTIKKKSNSAETCKYEDHVTRLAFDHFATIFPLFSAANAPKKDMSQKESQNVITWATHHVHRSRENQQMYMNIKNGSTLTGPRF